MEGIRRLGGGQGEWCACIEKIKTVGKYRLEGRRKTAIKLSQVNGFPGRSLNPGALEYEAGEK
jgi:hypothetical protein